MNVIIIACSILLMYITGCFLLFKSLIHKKGKKWINGKQWASDIIIKRIGLLTMIVKFLKLVILLSAVVFFVQVSLVLIRLPACLYGGVFKSNYAIIFAFLTIIVSGILVIKLINMVINLMKEFLKNPDRLVY